MAFWLMKSEPECFSIDDLRNCPNQTSPWDGVRNYQARNFMRDDMRPGDLIFFYHSNCKEPGIVGVARVASEPYPDFTAWDMQSEHPDPASTPENPRWYMVDVQFVEKFKDVVSLGLMKTCAELQGFRLLQKGNRLSVLPVEAKDWHFIMDTLRPELASA